MTDRQELARLRKLRRFPWAPGAKSRYVRILPAKLTGRRISRHRRPIGPGRRTAAGGRSPRKTVRSAMGADIDKEEFDEQDYSRFAERLEECLSALGQLLERPGFGAGPATVGAELELFLVDGAARPLPLNQAIRAAVADPASPWSWTGSTWNSTPHRSCWPAGRSPRSAAN